MPIAEIIIRANAHGQQLSLDGEEYGGGPYYLTTNRAQCPVVVSKLPIWAADSWPAVFSVMRNVVLAWEFALTRFAPSTPEQSTPYVKRLWTAAAELARVGKPVTCWTILARVHPDPRVRRNRAPLVGRVLTHAANGEPVIVYGGRGPLGLDGGTVVVGAQPLYRRSR